MTLRRSVLKSIGLLAVVAARPSRADAAENDANFNSISILAGEPEWLSLIQRLAGQLDHQSQLRILPMLGRGSVQALNDLSQLRSVDIALVSSDVIIYAQMQGLLSDPTKSYAYIGTLQKLPVVLVARKQIANLTGLAGRKIATGPAQSGSFATGELVLGSLGIPFARVAESGSGAISSLTDGRADAALLLGTEGLQSLDAQRFHVLPLPVPKELQTHYSPALLSQDVLGDLNRGQGDLESFSVTLTLAVLNWPVGHANSLRLKHFADVLWSAEALPLGTNLAADVPGWQRHGSAAQALAAIKPNSTSTQGEGP
jgi:uncharacterized protein